MTNEEKYQREWLEEHRDKMTPLEVATLEQGIEWLARIRKDIESRKISIDEAVDQRLRMFYEDEAVDKWKASFVIPNLTP